MNQVLLDNAYIAWKQAIHFHDEIEAGIASLANKKGFVSSLHNAVELFLKQIMLNTGDHRVAWLRNVTKADDIQLMKDYLDSNDLNTFFQHHDSKKFYSAEFSVLVDSKYVLLDNISESSKQGFTEAIKLLQDLRNNEMHFYIKPDDYLPEEEFIKLHSFMNVFFKAILGKKLFDFESFLFHFEKKSTKTQLRDYQKAFVFERNDIQKSFSYKKALKENAITKALAQYLNDDENASWAFNRRESYFELAWDIKWRANIDLLVDADKNYEILQLLLYYNMITLKTYTVAEPVLDFDGEIVEYENQEYQAISINL